MYSKLVLLILFSVGMIIVALEIPAIPADIRHELEQITLMLFAFFKTARFVIFIVWFRRRHCHAFYRLVIAIAGVIVWMLGMMLNEQSLQFLGLVVLTLSHCTECVIHACDEVRRDMNPAPSTPASPSSDRSESHHIQSS